MSEQAGRLVALLEATVQALNDHTTAMSRYTESNHALIQALMADEVEEAEPTTYLSGRPKL